MSRNTTIKKKKNHQSSTWINFISTPTTISIAQNIDFLTIFFNKTQQHIYSDSKKFKKIKINYSFWSPTPQFKLPIRQLGKKDKKITSAILRNIILHLGLMYYFIEFISFVFFLLWRTTGTTFSFMLFRSALSVFFSQFKGISIM